MKELKRCKNCGLPKTYPGVKFSQEGICNYCYFFDMYKEREEIIKAQLEKSFIKAINNIKKKHNKYDCVVAYSGGKDSTFLLFYLKNKFNLKILAHTLDNGFISPTAIKNIQKITKVLNIKSIITRPPAHLLRKIFKYALTQITPYPKEILSMMSPICVTCQGMVFGTTLMLAKKLKIPLMFIGYTPGQYPVISLENYLKVGSCVFFSSEVYKDDPLDIIKISRDPLDEKFGQEIDAYYFKGQYIKKGEFVPKVLFPFHGLIDYDEKAIYKELAKLGWEKPKDTDPCSTNCLLNTLGNYAAVKQLHFHPYIGELSFLVREGKMSYDNAIRSECFNKNSFAMHYAIRKLNINTRDL